MNKCMYSFWYFVYNILMKFLEIIFLFNGYSLLIVDFKKVLDLELLYGYKVSY